MKKELTSGNHGLSKEHTRLKISILYDKKFENTDYDYVVDLRPLGFNQLICMDLTVGLWNKGRDKDIADYLEQWKHNIVLMPKFNPTIFTIFSFGVQSNPTQFFKPQSKYENLSEFYS